VTDEEYIQACLEWLARNKAELDQMEKEYEALYATRSPNFNLLRLDVIDIRKHVIAVHEYELGGVIKAYIDKENE
jgi:hypothetical protein